MGPVHTVAQFGNSSVNVLETGVYACRRLKSTTRGGNSSVDNLTEAAVNGGDVAMGPCTSGCDGLNKNYDRPETF